ncbi:hypothetical protein Goari_011825 [Gossypium aridum]|uniref:RNase H type-1 domain-containing protein n=1 Tax=Gossypium aridum TaxID=34290 RepID=A0A7J8WYP6_GOSAI|nr:hypothetical protein [Gossypium aridum]
MEGKQQTAQDIRIIVASLDPNVKVNFDAAFKPQIHQSCSGFVIRNEIGLILGSGAVKNDYISYSFSAEAIACIQAPKVCGGDGI